MPLTIIHVHPMREMLDIVIDVREQKGLVETCTILLIKVTLQTSSTVCTNSRHRFVPKEHF